MDLRRAAVEVEECNGGERLVGEGARRDAAREGRETGAVKVEVEGLEGLADLEELEGMDRTDAAREIPRAARDVLDCRWWPSRGPVVERAACTFEPCGCLMYLFP